MNVNLPLLNSTGRQFTCIGRQREQVMPDAGYFANSSTSQLICVLRQTVNHLFIDSIDRTGRLSFTPLCLSIRFPIS